MTNPQTQHFFLPGKPRWPPGGGASEGDGGVEQLRRRAATRGADIVIQWEIKPIKMCDFSWEKWENMMIEYYD